MPDRLGPDKIICPYDVIIVLGAAVWPDGQPSPALRRRVAHGTKMFHQGQGRVLLLTGGLGRYAPSEAHVMRQLALEAGVPAVQILLEDQAISTFWSAVHCAQMLQTRGWLTALVVTDRYHLPRTLWTFRRLGIAAAGSAVEDRRLSPRWWRRWWSYVRECLALVWYLMKIPLWKAWRRGMPA